MVQSTKGVVDAKKIIEKLNMPVYLQEDAIREAWLAERDGRDVEAWLKYWLEQKELERAEPAMLYVDPALLDGRLMEDGEDGMYYDQYHGYVRDDV